MKPLTDPRIILETTVITDLFLKLTAIDTQSDPANSGACPSTAKQLNGQKAVQEVLQSMGLDDVRLDEHGYLYATLPANTENPKTIGLIAHIDTAPDYSGARVQPRLHRNYDGGDLTLNHGVVISPSDNPELLQCLGDTIITADGSTLLGADDKAGVAEIVAALQYLQAHPEIRRPTIKVAITPDEEIGHGAARFDVAGFAGDCAYTLDGGFSGEINGETFSADSAVVTFTGVAVHPGSAFGKMVNALRFASRFVTLLPGDEAPETTRERNGFYHPIGMKGNASEAVVTLILRDFDDLTLAHRGEQVRALAARVQAEEPRLKVVVTITQSYRNMGNWLCKRPEVFEILKDAVKLTGIEPRSVAVRGGTDGSQLTARGLPTPNMFAGGVNAHGPREWVSTRVMGLAACVVVNLAQRFAQ